MPIASKFFYFQRRRSPEPPPPPPEPPDPRRRRSRDAVGARRREPPPPLSKNPRAHRKSGLKLVPGNQRSTGEYGAATGSTIEPASGWVFRSRLSKDASDDRLPDAVLQARERLLQRLRSVDLTGTRPRTPDSLTIWAGIGPAADVSVSGSGDSRSGSLTECFESTSSLVSYKVQERTTESFSDGCSSTDPALCLEAVSKLRQEAFRGTKEGGNVEASVDCSICLEKFGDGDGLIQLHCKHIFHMDCLERWLQSHGDCPYCRASVFLTTE